MARKVNTPKSTKRVPKAAPHRFIVRSAAEAVEQVRNTLGPTAKVISVRQVKGVGLQRFLSSPRLEILACLTDEPEEVEKAYASTAVSEPPVASSDATEEASVAGGEILEAKANSVTSAAVVSDVAVAVVPQGEASARLATTERPSLLSRVQQEPVAATLTCGKFLNRAGFPDLLLARFSADAQWREICELPLAEGLTQAIRWIRAYRGREVPATLTNRIAFLGGPGSGKTTALCKILARDVFIRGLRPQVLRLEVDKPHLDDGLSLYCDVLGVPCFRSQVEVDFDSDALIYVDLPGYSLREQAEQDRVLKVLDRLEIDSRVLVMNAAYETAVLNRFVESGRRMGADFQILTHVDELDHIGKLWAFLLDTQRQLVLLSNGQNVAGDRIDDVLGFLIERTFPQ